MKYQMRLRISAHINENQTLLVRLIVGLIFPSEGIQKFLYPELGPGRFEKIGFDDPAFWAYFTACFEIICGSMVLSGILVRFAVIPLFIIMVVAFITTKLPILTGKGFWPFAHEYRTDFAMTLLSIYLFIYENGGKYKINKILKQ